SEAPRWNKLLIGAAIFVLVAVAGGSFFFLRKTAQPPAPAPLAASGTSAYSAPQGMAAIPGGTFTMGRDHASDPEETPAHSVTVGPFYLDKEPVIQGDFDLFMHRVVVSGTAPLPVTQVSWQEAQDYCATRGARLPTEAEWEFAARGTDGRLYPWGNNFAPGLTNSEESGLGKLQSADAHRDAGSPFGVLGMSGNVWQWTADDYKPY